MRIDSMTVGSLCSGIGGLDLGLERAGFSVLWQCEIDQRCRRVLAKHWPEVIRYGDIRQLTGTELEPVDLVCAGFPCQPTSTAGKRLGSADPRWLWPEVARLLGTLRPDFVLLENTPGLLNCGMGDVLRDLALLGYDAEWDCLPAAAFGAPHLRYRLFIVAYSPELRRDLSTGPSRGRQGTDEAARTRNVGTAPHVNGNGWAGRGEQPECLHGSAGAAGAGAAPAEARNIASFGRAPRRLVFPEPSAEYPAALRTGDWEADGRIRRVVHGFSEPMDRVARRDGNRRIEQLGNAVLPQVAQWLGGRILAAREQATR